MHANEYRFEGRPMTPEVLRGNAGLWSALRAVHDRRLRHFVKYREGRLVMFRPSLMWHGHELHWLKEIGTLLNTDDLRPVGQPPIDTVHDLLDRERTDAAVIEAVLHEGWWQRQWRRMLEADQRIAELVAAWEAEQDQADAARTRRIQGQLKARSQSNDAYREGRASGGVFR